MKSFAELEIGDRVKCVAERVTYTDLEGTIEWMSSNKDAVAVVFDETKFSCMFTNPALFERIIGADTHGSLRDNFDFENQAQSALKILDRLLNSGVLATEAKECLDLFCEYEWVMAKNADTSRFHELKEKGNSGIMSKNELDEFMGMVSGDGDTDLYFTIVQGHKLIAQDINRMENDIIRAGYVIADIPNGRTAIAEPSDGPGGFYLEGRYRPQLIRTAHESIFNSR